MQSQYLFCGALFANMYKLIYTVNRKAIPVSLRRRRIMVYELIREIFNQCPGNQMRDVFVESVETGDPLEYVKNYLRNEFDSVEVTSSGPDGCVIDVQANGLHQRFTFTED